MAGSIDLMKKEVEQQPEGLQSYWTSLSKTQKLADPSNLVFAGSGDSYSAALWAQELSEGKAFAYDPFELSLDPSRVRGKNAVILSVTGRTRSNLMLADKLKGIARKRIAVTGSNENPLARKCDDTLLLEYQKSGALSAGTASYTATLLACSFLLGKMPRLDLENALRMASTAGADLTLQKDSMVVFAGSGLNLPLAVYGGLKVNEVLGLKSIPCSPEQLVHAIIFSVDKGKDQIVLTDPSPSQRFQEVRRALTAAGFVVYSMKGNNSDPVARSFEVAFQLQCLAYNQAVRMGLEECAFLSNKQVLDLSSRMIY